MLSDGVKRLSKKYPDLKMAIFNSFKESLSYDEALYLESTTWGRLFHPIEWMIQAKFFKAFEMHGVEPPASEIEKVEQAWAATELEAPSDWTWALKAECLSQWKELKQIDQAKFN